MSFQPLIQEIDYRDPFDALRAFPPAAGLVFLDSAMAHPELGRWSWLAADPFARFTSLGGIAAWNGEMLAGHPMHALRRQLARYSDIPPDPRLPLQCGPSGFFTYEAGRLFERLPEPKGKPSAGPEIDLFFHDVGLAFDGVERRAFIVSTGWPEEDPLRRGRRVYERAE